MIGLFGGSFDPIHVGHLLAAQAAVEQLGLDELHFVPAGEQPFKRGRHVAGAEARAQMVALAIEGAERFRLDRRELTRPGPSYSYDTVAAVRAERPAERIVLLLGADAARDLPKWHRAAELAELAEIVAFARAGDAVPALPMITRTVDVPALAISSTDLRARAREGRSLRWWIPDAVTRYISASGLYLGPE